MDEYWKQPSPGPDPERGGPGDPYRPSWEGEGRGSPGQAVGGEPPENPWSPFGYHQSYPPAGGPRGRYRSPGNGQVSERSARLTLTLFAASVAVLIVGLVVFFTVRTLRQGTDNPVAGSGAMTPEGAGRTVGGIGPPPGVELGPYIQTRKAALAQVVDDRVAVVSLSDYVTEAAARELAGGAEVLALLAAAPGGQPAVVTGDIAGWVNEQTAEARAERDEISRLIPTVGDDPEFQSFYRSEVDRLNELISSIRADGELVFALVVRAPGPALRELESREEVRLVDVGATADPGPRPTYRGIRPEETGKANEPNTRPL